MCILQKFEFKNIRIKFMIMSSNQNPTDAFTRNFEGSYFNFAELSYKNYFVFYHAIQCTK